MKFLFRTLFLAFALSIFNDNYSVYAQEKDSLVSALNEKAIQLCVNKSYTESEKTFKQLFKLKNAVLPDESAFYFGVTSFYLKKYNQARKAFLRFETLSKASDSLKDESVEFRYDMDCYEKGYFEYPETCEECDGEGRMHADCKTCKGNGRQYCNVCSGTGVAVTKTSFGDNYSTCNRCSGKGIIDCLTCKGAGHTDQDCAVCKGKGVVLKRGICRDE